MTFLSSVRTIIFGVKFTGVNPTTANSRQFTLRNIVYIFLKLLFTFCKSMISLFFARSLFYTFCIIIDLRLIYSCLVYRNIFIIAKGLTLKCFFRSEIMSETIAETKVYSLAEVKSHASGRDCWIVVHNKVTNLFS